MDFIRQNQKIAELLPKLEAYQDEYIKTYPICFQGLLTHSIIPGMDSMPDELDRKPEGKPISWLYTALFESTATLPFAIQIDEYVTPKGEKGWCAKFFVTGTAVGSATGSIIDMIYTRSIGYGVEAELRTHNWQK